MVRVLAVADEEVLTYEDRARSLEVDLVVAVGDLPWDYLERLVSIIGAPAVYVPGNHEPQARVCAPEGMVSADDRVIDVAGLRIAGLGGCVTYNGGPHQFTQAEYAERADRLVEQAGPDGVDLLLTHAPPSGLGDEPDDPCHVGIEALHPLLDSLTPAWHLHGHVHPFGLAKADRHVGATTIRNVIPWTVLELEPRVLLVASEARSW
ncbi:hypothetical protein ASD11_03610 [Aeromicrobium sp. Root495]|uniref:metallophosphoesterase family protein n=1 Tax=Aeromicrobium sp. Root495 TaxID=1736550 RepID=UPI0007017B21|nr:metallophosphoesterase [Aeromicrobium sp. Root495]KQY58742.1 hypothetical protein ASD11_03610 [Aeromicrobium sp. Root495]